MYLLNMVYLMTALLSLYPALSIDENINECLADDTTAFRLDLMTDNIPQETTWEIINIDNNNILHECGPYDAETEENTLFNYTFCFDSDGCYKWTIRDLYGGFNEWFKLYWNGELIREGGYFNKRAITIFGNCPTSVPSLSPTSVPSLSPTSVPSTLSPISKPTKSSPTFQSAADITNDQINDESVDNDESTDGNINIGAVVGGTVGGIFFLGLFTFFYVKLFRTQTRDIQREKRKARRNRQKPPVEISARADFA